MHFGRPTPDQCEAYTRVLQGHIAIDSAIFPEGTSGRQLDVLARNALWKEGLNYLVCESLCFVSTPNTFVDTCV